MTGIVSADSIRHEREGVVFLLAGGFDDRQLCLDKAVSVCALRAERQLPPNHGVAKGAFAAIVGYFHVLVVQCHGAL